MERNSSGLVLKSTLIFLLLSSCNLPRPTPESQPLKDPKPAKTRPFET